MPYFKHLTPAENEANAKTEARMEQQAEAQKAIMDAANYKRKDQEKDFLSEHIWDFLVETGQANRIY
jgi:hypothetical protein|tara:strand:+ start:2352 stop:2552 length:201 start_codon:yes stop_codon:yes gene_type:complete